VKVAASQTLGALAETPHAPQPTAVPLPRLVTPAPAPQPAPVPLADINVVKVDAIDPVIYGRTLIYFITVSNAGQAAAPGVIAVDSLPSGVSFVSSSTSQGSCVVLVCQLGTLAPGSAATVTVVSHIDDTSPRSVKSAVCVSTAAAEARTDNNCDSESTLILLTG
jgi:uncharacterized repeat protein (TIGR01451 family)